MAAVVQGDCYSTSYHGDRHLVQAIDSTAEEFVINAVLTVMIKCRAAFPGAKSSHLHMAGVDNWKMDSPSALGNGTDYWKRDVGRPHRTYIDQLAEDAGVRAEHLGQLMADRAAWRERVDSVRATRPT
ncbi:hypothetical protein Bbelb_188790 [Branchiostoma belcheri]|nr:hypothetical protein Bbelb_188790 [Branchiostoma belcheri]